MSVLGIFKRTHTPKDSQRTWPRKRCWLTAFSSVFLLASVTIISAGTYWSVWGKQRNLWSLIELVVVEIKRDFTHGVAAIKGIWVLRHSVTANSMKLTACILIFLSLKSQTFFFFLLLPRRSVLFCFDGPLSGISFHLAVAALCPVNSDKSCLKKYDKRMLDKLFLLTEAA